MTYRNFYFDTLKKILDQSISSYSQREGKTIGRIDAEIADHIQITSPQYRNPDPNINYDEPLCRLGYLFTHAGANATLFEKTLDKSTHLQALLSTRATQRTNICTVGGGPGTELLGLTKYLLKTNSSVREISFTVLDRVSEWAETWNYIARECQDAFSQNLSTPPTVHQSFQTMDVVVASSYKSYAWLFEEAHLIVFNYLLSENQVSLSSFKGAMDEMIQRTSSGCFFTVIDRLEYTTSFRQSVKDIFDKSGLIIHDDVTIGETYADWTVSDNEAALGDYPERLSSHPRRWFSTPKPHRNPTVFALVAQKP